MYHLTSHQETWVSLTKNVIVNSKLHFSGTVVGGTNVQLEKWCWEIVIVAYISMKLVEIAFGLMKSTVMKLKHVWVQQQAQLKAQPIAQLKAQPKAQPKAQHKLLHKAPHQTQHQLQSVLYVLDQNT